MEPFIFNKVYSGSQNEMMNELATGATGGGAAHNNMQPYLTLNYIICLYGNFPPRP